MTRESLHTRSRGTRGEGKRTYQIHICYLPSGRSGLGKTVLEVGVWPEGTVFPNTDRPRAENNIYLSDMFSFLLLLSLSVYFFFSCRIAMKGPKTECLKSSSGE